MGTALLYGLTFGVLGCGLGGLIGALLGNSGPRTMSSLLAMSGGVMVGVVCFDLVPEAFAISGLALTLSALFLGAFAVMLLSDMVDGVQRRKPPAARTSKQRSAFMRAGVAIFIAISVHNFPEGLAIGSSQIMDKGLLMAVLISLHDIPEGIAMAVPLRAAGMHPAKVTGVALLSGIPTALGAVAGYLIGSVSPLLIATSLAAAGGAMLYVTFGEVTARSRQLHEGRFPVMMTIAGMALSLLIIHAL